MADFVAQDLPPASPLLLEGTPDTSRSTNASVEREWLPVDSAPAPAAGATYLQRVFSTGLNAWCAYNGVENPTPLAADTTPNWTGAIAGYERLGRTS